MEIGLQHMAYKETLHIAYGNGTYGLWKYRIWLMEIPHALASLLKQRQYHKQRLRRPQQRRRRHYKQ